MIQKRLNVARFFPARFLSSILLLLLSLATAADEAVETPSLGGYAVFQALFSLILVTVLIFGTAWLLKRFNPAMSQSGHGMKIIGALSLGGRDRLVLVEAGSKQLLLGVSPGRVMLVESFDEPVIDTESSGTPVEEKFRQLLRRS
ncbi:flagellar biosynthetic protein FliO [Kistimonas scapharcae]|uniref:Flagellar protein n=1 Tax=Kistimonas scapharcae TaxID=1036133 RepID=A0ABP8VAP9_9GAMM